MILYLWTRNDETGQLDGEFKDGDVYRAEDDSHVPGTQSLKSWLVIRIPDPPNPSKFMEHMTRSEFGIPETPGDDPTVKRKRIYRVDWRNKFTADEIAIIEDGNQQLPEGENVTNGIVENLFEANDISRK